MGFKSNKYMTSMKKSKGMLKTLSVAALAGVASMGATNSAQASEAPITPALGEDSSYTLTQVSQPTDNSVTLYKYDNTGITEAINYEVNLKTTEYGEGDTSKYYNWTKDVNGNYTLVESTNGSGDVVFKYDSTKTQATGRHYYGSNDDPNYTINENFISLPTNSNGNAIFNDGHINKITADFIDINALPVYGTNTTAYYGLVISNDWSSGAIIDSIEGNFVGNKATALQVYGGAIYNGTDAEIKNINANFIANGATSDVAGYVYGGAIYNKGTIGNITGDFIGNYAHRYNQNTNEAKGGAIYNEAGSIGNITGNFIGNYVKNDVASGKGAFGAAIYNSATIGDITGDFIGNYATGAGSTSTSSIIHNYGSSAGDAIIGDITGDFINNKAGYLIYSYSAMWLNLSNYTSSISYSYVGNINSNFINNTVTSSLIYGGGSWDSITSIVGDFINNTANRSLIDNVKIGTVFESNFVGNKANTLINSVSGMQTAKLNFYNNEVTSSLATGISATESIELNAVNNITKTDTTSALVSLNAPQVVANFENNKGGQILYANGTDSITVNFLNNQANNRIYSNGGFKNVTAHFENNTVNNSQNSSQILGGVFANNGYADAENINANFINNSVTSGSSIMGGVFYNSRIVENLKGDFIGNTVSNTSTELIGGGILANDSGIMSIDSNFVNNTVKSENGDIQGGVVGNGGEESNLTISADFIENTIESVSGDINGGALGNFSSAAFGYGLYFMMAEVENTGDFISNSATSTDGNALGGAIYSMGIDYDSLSEQMGNMGYGDIGDLSSLPYIEAVILNDDGSVYKSLALICGLNGNPVLVSALEEAIANGTLKTFVKMESEVITKSEFDELCEQEGMTEDEYFAMMEQMYGGAMVYGDPNDLLNKLPEDALPATIAHQTLESARANKASVTLKNSNILNNYASSQNGKAQGGAIYTEFDTVKIEANDGEAHLISGNYTKNGDVVDDNAIYAKDSKVIFDVTNGSTIQLDDNIDGENYETFIIGDQQSKFILNNKIKNSTTHLVDTNLYLTKDSHLDGNNLGLHSGMLSMINNQVGVSALNSLTVTGDTNVNVDVDLKNQTMDRFTASEYGSHSGNLNVTGMNLLSDAASDKTEILFAEQGLKDNVINGITSQLPDDKYQTTLFTPIYKYDVSYDNREDAGYFVFTRPTAGGSTGGAPSVDTFNPAVLGSSTSATVGAVGTMNQTLNHVFNNADTYMNIPYLERISMRDRNKYALSITGDATDMGRFSPLYQPSQEEASVWVKPYATFETVGLKNGPKVHNNTYGTLIGFDTQMQSLRRGWDRVFTGYIGYNGASQRYSGIDSTQNGGLLGGTMTLYKGNFFNATTVSVGASVASNQTMYGNEDFAMLLSGIGNKTGYNFEFKEGKLILQPSMLMSYTFVNTFDYTNAAGVRIDNKPLHALQLAPGVKVIGNLKGGWQPYASVQMVWNLMGESNATANGVKLPEMSIKPYVQYGVGVQKRIKDHFTAYGQAMVQNGGRNGVSLTAGFRWALGHDNCKYEKTQKDGRGLKSAKILKQMTPEQKMAHGGKYYNTSRTAKTGSLRQY